MAIHDGDRPHIGLVLKLAAVGAFPMIVLRALVLLAAASWWAAIITFAWVGLP